MVTAHTKIVSRRYLEAAMLDSASQPMPTTHTSARTVKGVSQESTLSHVAPCTLHGEIDDASAIGRPSDILANSEAMPRGLDTWHSSLAGTHRSDARHLIDGAYRRQRSVRHSGDHRRSSLPGTDLGLQIMSRGLATRHNPRAGTRRMG